MQGLIFFREKVIDIKALLNWVIKTIKINISTKASSGNDVLGGKLWWMKKLLVVLMSDLFFFFWGWGGALFFVYHVILLFASCFCDLSLILLNMNKHVKKIGVSCLPVILLEVLMRTVMCCLWLSVCSSRVIHKSAWVLINMVSNVNIYRFELTVWANHCIIFGEKWFLKNLIHYLSLNH